MPVPSEELIDIGGMRLASLTWGDRDAPPILCVHGWLDNAASFIPLIPYLEGFRVIALELPGHGHSDHLPTGMAYHALDYAVWLLEAAKRLGLERFRLIGHSMGTGVATLVAGAYPEMVSKLVMLDGIGPKSLEPEEAPDVLRAYVEERQRATRTPVIRRGAPFDTAVRARLAGSWAIGEHGARLLVERGVMPMPGGVAFRSDRRLLMTGPGRLTEAEVLAFLRRIQCETLLVLGESGLLGDSALVQNRKKVIARLTSVTVPGGHHVHMDNATAVGEPVRRFLHESE